VRLYHSLLRGDFPSRFLQLLQWPLVSLLRCAWPGRGQSVTELMPFMNFSVHLYTCHSNRHASPYWTSIRRLISMGFTPSLRCSLVHVASGAAIFTLLLRHRVVFLHRTATCRPLFKPWVSLLSTYKTIELCLEFLSNFDGLHLTPPSM
jgi:Fe2+ transport system protein FeoA